MKKIYLMILVLTLSLMVILSGCGNSNTEPTKNIVDGDIKKEEPKVVVKEETIHIDLNEDSEEQVTKEKVVEEVIEKKEETKSTPGFVEIDMIAKNWEFQPAEIKVKKGDKVKINIKSIDVNHGFFLGAFDIKEKLVPGETTVVEFTADKVGSFGYVCNVYCGSGHSGMKGRLIVE